MSITKDKPLVSVAMTTYNGARYLARQMQSIIEQTYDNVEVVVCDDQSSDGTIAILLAYQKKYPEIRIYKNPERLGVVRNFEKAMVLCRGKFIALADQDDIWQPDKIEVLLANIGEASMIFSDAKLIDGEGAPIADSMWQYAGVFPKQGKPLIDLVFRSFVTGCTAMIDRNLILMAFPIPAKERYHDWWLSLVACKANGLISLDQPLINYRLHDSNDTGVNYSSVWQKLSRLWLRVSDRKQTLKFKIAEMQKRRLTGVLHHPLFYEERQIVQDAHKFFENCIEGLWHPVAFKISRRYYCYVYPEGNFSGFLRFISHLFL